MFFSIAFANIDLFSICFSISLPILIFSQYFSNRFYPVENVNECMLYLKKVFDLSFTITFSKALTKEYVYRSCSRNY